MLLNKNERICVVAPSSSICEGDYIELNQGKKFVEKYVKEVVIDSKIEVNDYKVKANSLNNALSSNEYNFVIAACGGEGSINVIKYLDPLKIKNSLLGFSDITSILNYIYLETNIVTYHGCNLKTFGRSGDRKINEICFKDFEKVFTEEKYLIEEEKFKVVQEGKSEGILLGGNLTCFLLLAEIYDIDLENKILFLEDLGFETSANKLEILFKKLKTLKNFDKLSGIILGNYEVETKEKIEDIFIKNTNIDIPVIKTECIGHGKTNLIIPIGKKAVIDRNTLKIL